MVSVVNTVRPKLRPTFQSELVGREDRPPLPGHNSQMAQTPTEQEVGGFPLVSPGGHTEPLL